MKNRKKVVRQREIALVNLRICNKTKAPLELQLYLSSGGDVILIWSVEMVKWELLVFIPFLKQFSEICVKTSQKYFS